MTRSAAELNMSSRGRRQIEAKGSEDPGRIESSRITPILKIELLFP